MRGSTAPGPSANEPTSTHLLVPLPPVCTRAWARARSLRRAAQDARKLQQRFRSAAPKSIVQDECASAPSRAATPVHEGLAQSTRYTDFYAHAGMHWAVRRDTVDIVLLKQLHCGESGLLLFSLLTIGFSGIIVGLICFSSTSTFSILSINL